MGRDRNEQDDGGRQKRRSGQKPSYSPKGITSFKLSSDQVDDIRESGYDVSKVFGLLNGLVTDGVIKVTLGSPTDRPGCYAVIRDAQAAWDTSIAVSCWARTVEGALLTAGYYLSVVNPDFPEMPAVQLELEFLI